jgi:general secretion pathway protein B
MSFILDALKKSEKERERQQQPTVVEIPYGQRNRRQPVWLMIVVGLLVLNCVLLLLMWWRSSNAPAPAAAAAPVSITVAPPVEASASSSQNSASMSTHSHPSEVRPLLDEASEPEPADETAAALADGAPPPGPSLVRPSTDLDRAMAQQESQANTARMESLVRSTAGGGTNPTRTTPDNIPTLQSLGGNGALGLPPLRLDVHVYSSVATERFAFINSHKYQEGQVLAEGPTLEKVAQDGVILNYRGQRFLVPRQ